jgi:hypothetical protein
MSGEWGYAEMSDGTRIPLEEPTSLMPEENRLTVVDRPGLKMWIEKEQPMSVIESADYEETRQRLMLDPIVMDMAEGLRGVPKEQLVHNEDPDDPRPTPRFEFMMAANTEYKNRGGTDGGHIGAIAEVLLRLI